MAGTKGRDLYIDLSTGKLMGEDRENDERTETVDAFIATYGATSAKVAVYQVQPKTAKLQWVSNFQPDDVNEEVIRDEYGPGSYVLKLKDERGQVMARKTIDIAQAAGGGDGSRSSRNGHNALDPALQLQIENMRQSGERQHELLIAIIGKAMGANQQPAGPSMKDMVETMIMLRGEVDPMKQARDLIALGKDLAPPSADSGWASIVKDVAPAVASFLPAMGGAASTRNPSKISLSRPAVKEIPRPPRPEQQLEAPDPVPSAPVQEVHSPPRLEAPENPPEGVEELLRAQLDYWKVKARAGAPVDFWIDYVFLNPDEPQVQAVLYAIRHFSFDQLAAQDPELAGDLGPWFRGLYNGIHAELFNPDDSPGPSGHPPDPSDHAHVDAPGGGPPGAPGDFGGNLEGDGAGESESPDPVTD